MPEASAPVDLAPSEHTADPADYWVDPPKDGVVVSGRVDAAMAQRIVEVVQSGKTRYRTISDYVRAAAYWFMVEKMSPRMDGRFQSDMKLASASVRRAQLLMRVSDASAFVRVHAEAMRKLVLEDDIDSAAQEWADTWSDVQSQGEVFRRRAEKLLLGDSTLKAVRRKATERGLWDPEDAHEEVA